MTEFSFDLQLGTKKRRAEFSDGGEAVPAEPPTPRPAANDTNDAPPEGGDADNLPF